MFSQGLLVSEELASKVHEAGNQAYRVKKTGLDRYKGFWIPSALMPTHVDRCPGHVLSMCEPYKVQWSYGSCLH